MLSGDVLIVEYIILLHSIFVSILIKTTITIKSLGLERSGRKQYHELLEVALKPQAIQGFSDW